MRLLRLLTGVFAVAASLFRRRLVLPPSLVTPPRPAANPHGLTVAQLAVKVEMDSFLDRDKVGLKAFCWGARRTGRTYLAHVIHQERGGVVVTRSTRAAKDFRHEHIRMFGQDAHAVSANLHNLRGRLPRGSVIITDVQPHCPHLEFEAEHIGKVISLRA